MVKAEISYNPYLLETIIKFNGKPPRINSLVEKFKEKSLQLWINKIPKIFHDEMNGYDFELEFSGTLLDYNELINAFSMSGVTDKQIHYFLKNELGGRNVKVQDINELLEWLDKNRNRKFNFDIFKENNSELFDNAYSFIIIQGNSVDTSVLNTVDMCFENINSLEELKCTKLSNTPILIYIDKNNLLKLQENLGILLKRPDVVKEQIFFMINESLSDSIVIRTIEDLGVENPQVVSSLNDDIIKKYIELYPVSNYIYSVIKAFEEEKIKISEILEKENKNNLINNQDVHRRIDSLENTISNLKSALERFTDRDNIELPAEWLSIKNGLHDEINNWKIRKTKINKAEEAIRISAEFNCELKKMFELYLKKIGESVLKSKDEADKKYKSWYTSANFDVGYNIDKFELEEPILPKLPNITSDLLELRDENYIESKKDFIGLIFRSSSDLESNPVLETTYYYQNWRDYANMVVSPIAENIMNKYFTALQTYEQKVTEDYIEHLDKLLSQLMEQKEQVSSQLSESEQKLQCDNDWFVNYCDKLNVIERR